MRFREVRKILLADGWVLKTVCGSHYQYIHPVKPGKVTVPRHRGDISPRIVRRILKEAGLRV